MEDSVWVQLPDSYEEMMFSASRSRQYHPEILLMEKFYEDVEAEMKDVTDEADVHPKPQKRKLSQSRKGNGKNHTEAKERQGGAKQVITDTEKERRVEKQDEET